MGRKTAELDRETWISLLDAALERPGTELNDEWAWLLDQLGMTAEQYPAVLEALRQGRWREATNPRAYLKTVARREALKEQLTAQKQDNLVLVPIMAENEAASVEGTLDHLAHLRETAEAVQGADGIWRRGGGAERDEYEHFDEDEYGRSLFLRGRILAQIPQSLKVVVEPPPEVRQSVEEFNASTDERHIHLQPAIGIDMGKWAELAGFDEWEMQVLHYRLDGVSRDKALAEQPDEPSRKALQAAWERYDRTGNQRLRDFADYSGTEVSRNSPKRTLEK